MILLVVGMILWCAWHLVPILAPARRAAAKARMGEGPWRGLYSLVSLALLAIVVIGYRRAAFVPVWEPPLWLWHLNNALMVLAVFLFFAGFFPGPVRRRIRNPMLTGVKTWAVAHLAVNGDLASIILFGGFLAWAVVAVVGIKRRDGPRGPLPEATTKGLILHLVATAVVFVIIVLIHSWAGRPPFPG